MRVAARAMYWLGGSFHSLAVKDHSVQKWASNIPVVGIEGASTQRPFHAREKRGKAVVGIVVGSTQVACNLPQEVIGQSVCASMRRDFTAGLSLQNGLLQNQGKPCCRNLVGIATISRPARLAPAHRCTTEEIEHMSHLRGVERTRSQQAAALHRTDQMRRECIHAVVPA